MNRLKHNARGKLLGIGEEVADTVNKDKDAPSRIYPGCRHHGFNHGVGTNLKYSCIGQGGALMSILHNLDDRLSRKCLEPIIVERMRTWVPGKLIKNVASIGDWWEE